MTGVVTAYCGRGLSVALKTLVPRAAGPGKRVTDCTNASDDGLVENLVLSERVTAGVRRALAGVAPLTALPEGTTGTKIVVDPLQVPVPHVPAYILREVLGLKDYGRWMEKVAWEIDLSYRGIPMTMSHRKFGVDLTVWNGDASKDEAVEAGRKFLAAMAKAVRVVDAELLIPAAESAIAAGNVTVANKYHQLRGHYDYFREVVAECLAGQGRWVRNGRASHRLWAREQEAFINFTAAVHGYFSWLEHVLVLVLPFIDFDPMQDDLRKIIGSGWREKFKRVFPVATDPVSNRLLSDLVELSERTRNTWSHGGFDKSAGLLYAHVPGLGATPLRVSEFGKNVHFVGVMGVDVDFEGAWALLDAVDAHIDGSDRTKYGALYARAGLQVMFDAASRNLHMAAMASDAAFESFIDERAHYEDRLANMDW